MHDTESLDFSPDSIDLQHLMFLGQGRTRTRESFDVEALVERHAKKTLPTFLE
jgi:hypothetical protein